MVLIFPISPICNNSNRIGSISGTTYHEYEIKLRFFNPCAEALEGRRSEQEGIPTQTTVDDGYPGLVYQTRSFHPPFSSSEADSPE